MLFSLRSNLKKCDGAIKENGIHVTGENNQESFVALERSIEPICDRCLFNGVYLFICLFIVVSCS